MANKNPERKLTDTFIKTLNKPGRHGDARGGHGLSVKVRRTALGERTGRGGWAKTWCQRIKINGRRVDLGLGSYPVVSLAMARDKALDNAKRVKKGEDIRKPPPTIPTVAEAFKAVIKDLSPSWRGTQTLGNWQRSLAYCKRISSMPVSQVTRQDVLGIIKPLWHEKGSTAKAMRSHLSMAMQWAMNEGFRETNAALPGVVQNLGRQSPTIGHPSLEQREVGSALALVRDADVWWATKVCLLFLAFTGVRSGEARKATWDEIDLKTATWTMPGARTKNGKEFKIPLSTQALQILRYAEDCSGRRQGSIFPPERGGKYMNSGNLSSLVKRLKISCVPHGFRKSIRNWAAVAWIVQPAAEMILGHKPSNAVVEVYLTTDFFEMRQPIMQDWADYLTETMGPVIPTIAASSATSQHPDKPVKEQTLHLSSPLPENNSTPGKSSDKPITPRSEPRESRKRQTSNSTDNKGISTAKEAALKRVPLTPEERRERQRIQFKAKLEGAKSLGLCRHCGEPAIEGQTRCETCAEKHRGSHKNRQKERNAEPELANGDPSNKPKVPDYLGSKLPQPVKQTTLPQAKPLSEKTNSESRREYERLRAQRPERREAIRKAAQVHRQKAKELGLCRACRNPALLGKDRCEICAEKHRQENQRGAAVRRAKQKTEQNLNNPV